MSFVLSLKLTIKVERFCICMQVDCRMKIDKTYCNEKSCTKSGANNDLKRTKVITFIFPSIIDAIFKNMSSCSQPFGFWFATLELIISGCCIKIIIEATYCACVEHFFLRKQLFFLHFCNVTSFSNSSVFVLIINSDEVKRHLVIKRKVHLQSMSQLGTFKRCSKSSLEKSFQLWCVLLMQFSQKDFWFKRAEMHNW